jgi:erythromycin esterase
MSTELQPRIGAKTMADKKSFADWVTDKAIAAETLDPRAPLDDLEPLREVIGDSCVVAIGESDHYVREFYLLRHRLLHFLAERCGFTVYALEAPFTEAHAIDAWVRGGPGTVEKVAAAGVAFNQGRPREMHDLLEWMRARNRTAAAPLRFAGAGLTGSGGSPLPALEEVGAYLRRYDPDALPLLEQATEYVRKYHSAATFKALLRYASLDKDVQDALSATLGRLLARMEMTGDYQRGKHRGQEHATALQHLRGVWHLDHFHRDFAGRGISVEHPHAHHDAFMAESVLRLLEDGTQDTRIVVAYHNIHIQKTAVKHEGVVPLLPGGYHLAQALGDDYVAIAVTSNRGRTARVQMDPEHPLGFEVRDLPLPPPADGSVETAFAAEAPLTVADLRAARLGGVDAESFQRMRMEDYFMDVPVFEAFDALACVTDTSVSEMER